MNKTCARFLALMLSLWSVVFAQAGEKASLEIVSRTKDSIVEGNLKTHTSVFTNGVIIKFSHPTYGTGVLEADQASVNYETQDIVATGHVRIQRDNLVWSGEDIRYNIISKKIEAVGFRAGSSPVFASGGELSGDRTNNVYTGKSAFVTTDDVAEPAMRIRASSIKIVPGESIEARNAVLFVGNVPVFYFPYYRQRLDGKGNDFTFVPGYRSRYGGYLLSSYNWIFDEHLDGKLHADYRTKRGGAGGADFNLHLGQWGETSLKYYYLHDLRPDIGNLGFNLSNERQRAFFGYDATPFTNLTVKAQVRYQSDERVMQNFLESEYRVNPQPSTFVEVNKSTDNFSLDVYAQPRINEFFENVERLPDVRLTGFRQQVLDTPFYYESETSAGYFRRRFAVTNTIVSGADYSATRADTFQQLTLPQTYFGWLNLTPRVGGRLTYYGDPTGPGATTVEENRGVFNTGAELTFKASQTWAGKTNRLFALDGLRHIVEPSVNYVYVPRPHPAPGQVPQFDTELPSLRQLPLEFPSYNSVDSVDSQNTLRLGLRNRLQTKRAGQIEDFFYWDVYTDWRLRQRAGQNTFSDIFSDFVIRPRTWLSLESATRYDMHDGLVRLAFHNLTIQPNETWSWGIGHLYVRDDFSPTPTALQAGNSFLTSSFFLRVNENWGLRAIHQYEVREQWLQEQSYSIYRDLRNWTAALSCRLRDNRNGPDDITVAFTFSLKASPRYNVGEDAVRPARLLGY